MAGSIFLKGAIILLAAGIINRILGFLYQIAMVRLIGSEGVGLFNMVFPFYIMVLVLATAGIPVAISKLVAEEVAVKNYSAAYRVLWCSLSILILTSIFFTLALVIGAPLIKEYLFHNPKVYYSFISLIPGIVIVSVCSAFRGFFQGLQQMTPTAVTQTIEQLVRVTLGLIIAYHLLPKGIEFAAIGLSLGVVLGELAGLIFMLRIFIMKRPISINRRFNREGAMSLLVRIFNLAMPVTLTRFAATALMSVQAILIPQRLHASGMSFSQATSEYGQLVGIAEPLLFIPGVFTMALATAMVPAMSDAMALNNLRLVKSRISDAMRLTIQVGLPSAAILVLLSDELCGVLFGYPQAGVSLSILALAGPFLYLQQATTGILQGMGKAEVPFKNLMISSLFCLAGIYYLTAIPEITIKGTSASIGAGFLIMSVLNVYDLYRISGFTINVGEILYKPVLSILIMTAVIQFIKWFLSGYEITSVILLLFALCFGCWSYLLIMFISGGINEYDIAKFKAILFKIRR